MQNCKLCKRIIASDTTREVCDVCFETYDMEMGYIEDAIEIHGLTDPQDIAAHTHLSVKRVKLLLGSNEELEDEVEDVHLCARCHKNAAMTAHKYCLRCHLSLYKTLGDEVRTTAKKPYVPNPKSKPAGFSAMEALEEKRNRTGFKRFDPTTKSIKGTGGK